MAIDPGICLMTVSQVAEILNYSNQTVHLLIKKGELLALRIGREYRISWNDLNNFLERKRIRMSKA